MNKLKATLPDGTTATRQTMHDYKFICAVQVTYVKTGVTHPWFAQWSMLRITAEKRARSWEICPAVKAGQMRVKTAVLPVND
jgi:hypothetical protein